MKKLTEPQLRILKALADIAPDKWLGVSGHSRAKCFRLAERGLAERQGGDGFLTDYYTITEAGRQFLAQL